jgi:hypothetical protein
MASDSFTGSDGTLLSAHNGGVWDADISGYAPDGDDDFTIISNQIRGPSFQQIAYRRADLSSNTCQIVKKGISGGSTGNSRFGIAVRMGTATLGYNVRLTRTDSAPDTWLDFNVYKNTTLIGSGTLPSAPSVEDDATIKITATASGSDQVINVWFNGSACSFTSSTNGASHLGVNLTDPSANTPLTTGSPGFFVTSSSDTAENWFDDWTDGDTGGGSSLPIFTAYYRMLNDA